MAVGIDKHPGILADAELFQPAPVQYQHPTMPLRQSSGNSAAEETMELEERMSKVEAETAVLKEGFKSLQTTVERNFAVQQEEMRGLRDAMERGFAEQREATNALREAMERGFAEQRAALAGEREARERSISELRQEMHRGFRWTFSALLSILALLLGIIAKLAGAF